MTVSTPARNSKHLPAIRDADVRPRSGSRPIEPKNDPHSGVEDFGGALVLRLRGRVDLYGALQLRRELATVPMHRSVIVVDFFDVPECHPCVHTVLTMAARRLHGVNVQLVLWRVRRQPFEAIRGRELQRAIPFVVEPLETWLAAQTAPMPPKPRRPVRSSGTSRESLCRFEEAARGF